MRLFLAFLAVLVAARAQGSTVDDSHYVAAVVDFHVPLKAGMKPEENLMENIETAAGLMTEAAEQGADIILFPEDGLQGLGNERFPMHIPGPEEQITPCTATDDTISKPLRRLSCLADEHKMYLVVNLVHEVSNGSGGHYYYNTDVAFDRSGKIVARYHKYNLFGERGNNVPPTVEYSVFDTDFGVRFGMFICFDILFRAPSLQLVTEKNITDIVFTAAWFSEVPFLTAVQAHSGWAHALDVTVLASGFNYPATGSTGSGIYLGRHGILNATMNWRTETTLMVHSVPKHSHWDAVEVKPDLSRFDPVFNYGSGQDPFPDVEQLRMKQDNMTMYSTAPLKRLAVDENLETSTKLCNGDGLCCNFDVKARGVALFATASAAMSLHGYSRRREAPAFNRTQAELEFDGFHYKMVAFSGVRDHSHVATTGVQICGLISCLSDELASCGWISPGLGEPTIKWTEFLDVRITAEYEKEGTLQFASTVAGPRYDPLPASYFDLQIESGTKPSTRTVRLSLNQSLLDLRTFAIYGRHFAWDGEKATGY